MDATMNANRPGFFISLPLIVSYLKGAFQTARLLLRVNRAVLR
jgi:hypothetical protein